MTHLKVAAIQYPLDEGLTRAQHLEKIASYIKDCDAELLVFPELITTELVDWSKPDRSQLELIAREFAPEFEAFLTQQARASGKSILGGTTPRLTSKGIVNTAVLALPNGRTLTQDKLFLTPDEKDWGWVGGDRLNIFETPWGKTVISICFDTEFPAVSQLLSTERPDLILVPSWTSTHSGLNRVDFSSRARAVEHFAYVVKTGTVAAPNATQPHFGQASVHTPQEQGFPVEPSMGEFNRPHTLFGTLDFALLRERKSQSGYYPSNEQSLRKTPITIERN